MRQAERVADGDDRLADHQIVRDAHCRDRHVFFGQQFHDGEIGFRIRADDFPFEFAVIRQRDRDFRRFQHDMIIGQHVAALVNNHARTEAVLLIFPARKRIEKIAEKLVEKRVRRAERTLSPHDLLRADIHDRRTGLLDRLDNRRPAQ